ncbi:MAG: hypothetical protein ACOVQ2_10125, partial [Flavobacterium sp.]
MEVGKIRHFFNQPFFVNQKFIIGFWVLAAVITGIKQFFTGSYNNYLIFKNVFNHLINQQNLY